MRVKSPRWTTERFKLASRVGCFHDMKVELVGGEAGRDDGESRAEVFSEPQGKNYASRKVFAEGHSLPLRVGEPPNVIEASIPVIEVPS